MKTVVSVLLVLLVLPAVCSIALADAVPGALLYLDARDNRAHPGAWRNLGAIGGELSGAGNSPELEEGAIAIPALDIDTISRFYTHRKSGQCWGDQGDNLKLFLNTWTIEILLKINGDSHRNSARNQLAGFRPQEAARRELDSAWFLGGCRQALGPIR